MMIYTNDNYPVSSINHLYFIFTAVTPSPSGGKLISTLVCHISDILTNNDKDDDDDGSGGDDDNTVTDNDDNDDDDDDDDEDDDDY